MNGRTQVGGMLDCGKGGSAEWDWDQKSAKRGKRNKWTHPDQTLGTVTDSTVIYYKDNRVRCLQPRGSTLDPPLALQTLTLRGAALARRCSRT
jgi:hypothetical protein